MSDKQYTLEEIATHNTADNLWLIVEGKVYDVTSFLEKHPGGQKPFLNYAGKDATERFKVIGAHMESLILGDLMKTLCIGSVKN
jgi:cytochrome b5